MNPVRGFPTRSRMSKNHYSRLLMGPTSNGVNIFNSLGSNYSFTSAMRMLFSVDGQSSEANLKTYLEHRYKGRAILTYKGREALFLAASALREGDIAINGFTCFAVYEAIVESGHAIHYIDIPKDALNFTSEALRAALASNPSIRAVVVQNTFGITCDIRGIKTVCDEHGIALIEDLAHSIGARYASGDETGSVGDFVILTFSQDKVVDAVSGGALIIRNEKYGTIALSAKKISYNQQLKDRLYPSLTWKIRAAYGLGIGKFVHAIARALHLLSTPFGVDSAGSVHRLPRWYCANILREFENLEVVASHRRVIAETYQNLLDNQLQFSFDTKYSANLRFPIRTENRDNLIAFLKERGVFVSDIWYDAPIAPKKYLHRTNYAGQCPNAEHISDTILNLPTHINVSRADATTIAAYINEWLAAEHTKEYEVQVITDYSAWEAFIEKLKPHSFLHSWKWGEHYEETGSKIFRIGLYQGKTLIGIALLIKIQARRGSFLLCPHGPLIANPAHEEGALAALTEHCIRIGKDERCDFLRFCPLSPASQNSSAMYKRLGFRDAPIHMHPELAWILDITKSEDDLLREMRKTTRYLVKKMERDGVLITQSNNSDDIEKFWPIYQATVERQHFTPFSKESLKKEFELFAKDDQAAFFFGKYRGEVVAAAIIIFYNGQAFYHHSGSIHKSKDINASYLLQWHVIQEAKRRGCTLYNLWGISPENRPKHPWAGLSLFKKGFGGFAEAYLHAQDKPLTPKYALNYLIETTRRLRRGL